MKVYAEIFSKYCLLRKGWGFLCMRMINLVDLCDQTSAVRVPPMSVGIARSHCSAAVRACYQTQHM
jgi:hypothetical protein